MGWGGYSVFFLCIGHIGATRADGAEFVWTANQRYLRLCIALSKCRWWVWVSGRQREPRGSGKISRRTRMEVCMAALLTLCAGFLLFGGAVSVGAAVPRRYWHIGLVAGRTTACWQWWSQWATRKVTRCVLLLVSCVYSNHRLQTLTYVWIVLGGSLLPWRFWADCSGWTRKSLFHLFWPARIRRFVSTFC